MRKTLLTQSALLGILFVTNLSAQSSPSGKVAVLNWNRAVVESTEGKQASADFQKKLDTRKEELNKVQEEIQKLQSQLNQGGGGEETQAALARQIDSKTTALKRSREDSEKEFSTLQNEIMARISQKIIPVVNQYAQEKNVSVVIDSSNQTAQLVYYDTSIEITDEIIKRFDATQAPATGATAAPSSAKPAPTPPATPK
jgi:Skp family chaperone for outer membrane proteins